MGYIIIAFVFMAKLFVKIIVSVFKLFIFIGKKSKSIGLLPAYILFLGYLFIPTYLFQYFQPFYDIVFLISLVLIPIYVLSQKLIRIYSSNKKFTYAGYIKSKLHKNKNDLISYESNTTMLVFNHITGKFEEKL